MCSCDFADFPEFFSAQDRKARKEHGCCDCPIPIKKGETYHCASGKWDGEVGTYRRHLLCHDASKMSAHCFSAYGAVREDIQECELPKKHPARNAWALHLWQNRKHPKAGWMRVNG